MSRSIVVAADEAIGCPKCGHGFPLSEGISRQAIERHAEEHDRALAAKESARSGFRAAELDLRRQLRELEDKAKNQDLDYQHRLDEEAKRIEAKARASAVDEFSRREAQLKALGSGPDSDQRSVQTISDLTPMFQQTQGEALE